MHTFIRKIGIVAVIGLILHDMTLGQKSYPLYESIIPNNKDLAGMSDTASIFHAANGTIGHFINRIIKPEIFVYLPTANKNTGAAVIICPGGGYAGLAIDHEGHAIAKKLAEQGIAGIVLKNRVPNPKYVINKTIVPLQDAQRAILFVREHAMLWKINNHKIGIMGSSAGGHLASTAGTHFNHLVVDNPRNTSVRPDFMILNYPVISFADSITHRGSRNNLIGEAPNNALDNDLVRLYSNELQVTDFTPPTFINHSYNDDVVPVANSIVFIAACLAHHVPVQSYFYTAGGHGYGLDNPTSKEKWFDACLKWLKKDVLNKK